LLAACGPYVVAVDDAAASGPISEEKWPYAEDVVDFAASLVELRHLVTSALEFVLASRVYFAAALAGAVAAGCVEE
jgi:hypothetical protein